MKKALTIFCHGFIAWALCGAIVAVGREVSTMQTTLIIHAILAPIVFGIVSFIYFRKFAFTTPLQTALIFFFLALAMDAGIVSPLIEKSYAMFSSILGLWIPMALNFGATLTVGMLVKKKAV